MSKNDLVKILTYINVSQFTYVSFECSARVHESIWKPDGYGSSIDRVRYSRSHTDKPVTIEEITNIINNEHIYQILKIRLSTDDDGSVEIDVIGNTIQLDRCPTVDLEALMNLELREINIIKKIY